MKKFDAIIIGTGQAGPSLAASLAKHDYKLAIIEKSHLGGSCVNTGCTPTKAYVASARRAFLAGNSEELGVNIDGKVNVDMKQIKRRKDEIIANSRSGLEKMLGKNKNIDLIRGKAEFVNNNTVKVNGEELSAPKIYINVGGRPRIPKAFQAVNYLTNRSILELEEVPEELVVVGGGYVGLEFAQIFSRFGSKVTVLEQGKHILGKEDEALAEAVTKMLKDSGIKVLTDVKDIQPSKANNKTEIQYTINGKSEKLISSHVLVATGRILNTDDLGLENTDVDLDDHGNIKVNNELQTSVKHIWALGDCNGEGHFTHTAYNDFQIVNSHLFEEKKRYLSDRITCYAAFIDPAFARVGLNEKQIKEKGVSAKVASIPMGKIARAKEMGETTGMLKIYIEEATDKYLGATFFGTGADEYIHTIIDQMYAGASYQIIRDAVHIHPTISELIPTMLEDLKPL